MKPNWLLVVSFKTELLSEYLTHKGYREDLTDLLPEIGLLKNRMIIDNDIYVDLNEVTRVQEILSKDIITYGTQVYATIEHQSERLLKVAKEGLAGLTTISNQELITRLKNFFKEYQKTLGPIGIPTIIDLTLETMLKQELKNSGIQDIEDTFRTLAIAEKSVATTQEREDMLDLAIKKEAGVEIDDLIKAHAEKYGWLYSTLLSGDIYSPEKIAEEINLISEPAKQKSASTIQQQQNKQKASEIIDHLNEPGQRLATFLQTAVYFRTARLEWLNEGCFIARPLLQETAKRLDISFDDLIYLYPEEIFSALDATLPIPTKEIADRQKSYAFISDDSHEYALFTREESEDWKNRFMIKSESDTVKGLVACKGQARGTARIIKDRSELGRVEAGDIIVTPLTTPDFIVAMKKAGAIITDLGGMTSHAAIVARELNIPCIVGTKNATKVIKDGDEVEINADTGIITIIR